MQVESRSEAVAPRLARTLAGIHGRSEDKPQCGPRSGVGVRAEAGSRTSKPAWRSPCSLHSDLLPGATLYFTACGRCLSFGFRLNLQ